MSMSKNEQHQQFNVFLFCCDRDVSGSLGHFRSISKLDPETYGVCGFHELLVSNIALQLNEKQVIKQMIS